MAWENLLKKPTEPPAEVPVSQPEHRESTDTTLLQQLLASEQSRPEEETPPADQKTEEKDIIRFADGYVRRTPVQTYQEAPDYKRRIAGKLVTLALLAALVALAAVALYRAGILRF